MTSPTACGALFSARTTPQSSQNLVELWWNPSGTLVEPSWNLTSGPPRTTPEPIWAETPKLSAVRGKKKASEPFCTFYRCLESGCHRWSPATSQGQRGTQYPKVGKALEQSGGPVVSEPSLFGLTVPRAGLNLGKTFP